LSEPSGPGAPRAGDAGGPGKFLVAAGIAQLGLLAAAGWWPGNGLPFPTLPLLGAAFGIYLLAAASLGTRADRPRARAVDSPPESPAAEAPARPSGAWPIGTIWLFAFLFRATLLPLDPLLSDDVYRYLWDGHVQLQGTNPYLHPPDDPALESIRTEWHPRVNHPDVPTIYPPLAQLFFRAGARLALLLGSGVLAFKLLWIGCEMGAAFVLGRVARRTGRSEPRVLLLFLWSPLLVVETAWSGHLEALGLLWLALLLWMALPARTTPPEGASPAQPPGAARAAGAGVAAAFATLTKFAPAAALPPLARRLGAPFVVAFLLAVALLHAPFLEAGSQLWTGLRTYGEHWRANEGLFLVFDALLPGGRLPRLAVGVAVLGVVGWTTLRRFDPERALFWILGAGLLLSPTLHPWYVLWILPFAALRASVPWLLLGGLVFAGYWGAGTYHETGIWPEPFWVRAVIWLPFLALLARQAVSTTRGETQPADPHPEIPAGE
jgi:hypothetical protein